VPGKFFDWLDHRTGYRKFRDALLLEHIPGGAKWRYVWGSALVFVFTIQLVTGILLMTSYSPGDSTAWGSVYYIQYEMDFGWLIRGLHHFGSQTMVVLIGLHMLQVVIAGAHLPPREINWWLGLLLMACVLGLSLTGYLLPWDQKGFWATQVATNILGSLPVIGAFLQKSVVGGSEYGHHTLTHFYALHVGILPAVTILLIVLHLVVFRRHGVTHPKNPKGEGSFWPDQAFRDMLVSLIIFGVMLGLVIYGHGNSIERTADGDEPGLYERWAKAGRDGAGAHLDAPADPDKPYPARPEWYFLFLFQLLKYFEGDYEIVGTVIVPGAVTVLLFLLPLLGYGRMRAFGHFVGVVVVVSLLVSVGLLTCLALAADSPTPSFFGLGGTREAEELQKEFKNADIAAKRVVQLAQHGVPEEGGRMLLRGDPLTKGLTLFEQSCAVCHSFTPKPDDPFTKVGEGPFKAPDLGDYASETWIRRLLDDPGHEKYFGRTGLSGMKLWKKGILRVRKKMSKEEVAEEEATFDLIAKWLAQQAKPKEERDDKLEKIGFDAFEENCSSCHTFKGKGAGTAPDFTDYASPEWIRLMIMSPAHKLRHAAKNEMPAFRNLDGPGAEVHLQEFLAANPDFPRDKVLRLSDFDRELIIRFMTRDQRVVFGGRTVAAPPKK
jgi:quinol-cytochrome oxidoreductase complex cytochrome b subunit/mono/diheme cytochrome c family protein